MKKLDLTKIGIATEKKDSKYPVMPDTPDLAVAVDSFVSLKAQIDALDGSLELHKAALQEAARPFFFKVTEGKTDIPSSIEVHGTESSVLVTFKKAYKEASEDALNRVIGAKRAEKLFKQFFSITIDGNKIPETKAQTVIKELTALFEKHGCSDALSAKSAIKPMDEFHTARHTLLTYQENMLVDAEVSPMVISIKERK